MENVPAHNSLTIPGDFNAKLGPDYSKYTFHTETNCKGELLVDFMEESYGHLNTTMVQRPN